MKNFKKLFAVAASVMMLASTLPAAVLGASYSDELQGAYDYAYGIGITTQPTIDTANMYGTLIRSHMAKMMVNYAKEVLGKTADTSLDCNFTDIANQSDELRGYIVESCQLGLMGQGITAFNPNGMVTRAQFGTVLSRALYGDTYNGGDPYYADHLTALQDAGIMNNISNPNAPEVRGYVMLMMQRAAGADTPAICETPENVLSCSLGLDTCPTECQNDNTVKAGTLNLSSIGVDYTNVPGTGDVVFGSIKLTAGGSDITVNSIKIKKLGLSSLTSPKVWFEKDGVRITSRAAFNTDDNTALVSFTTPLVVKSSETIDVVMQLTNAGGSDVQLVSTDVNSTAETVDGSFASASLRASTYAVTPITLAATSFYDLGKTVRVDSSALVSLGELQLTKTNYTNRALIVKSLTINNSGTSDLSFLNDVALYRDDIKVSTATKFGSRTISFVLNNEIKSTESSAVYVIKGKVTGADRIDDTYDLYVRNETDLVAIEKDTLFRTRNTGAGINVGFEKISGGDVRFNELTVSALTVAPGAKKVPFYSGTISAMQPVRLNLLTGLTFTLPVGTTNLNEILDNLYVKIGNSIISADSLDLTAGQKISFDGEVTVNGTVPFTIYGDIKTNYSTGGYLMFTNAITTADFAEHKYTADDSDAGTIGSIGGRKATFSTTQLSLSNSSSTSTVAQRGDRNVEIAKLEFATNSDIVMKLTSFAMTFSGTVGFKDAQVTIYNESGLSLASSVIRTAPSAGYRLESFSLPTTSISKGNPVKFIVKLDQVPNAVQNTDQLVMFLATGDMTVKDIISNASIYPNAPVTGTTLNISAAGTPEVVTQLSASKLIKYGAAGVELGNIQLKSNNGDVVMRDVWFNISGLNAGEINQFNSLKLYENNQFVANLLKNGDYVYATNVNAVLSATAKTYKVVADISNITNSGNAITSTPKLEMVLNIWTGGGTNTGACTDGKTTFESTYGATGVDCSNFLPVGGAGTGTTKDTSVNLLKFVNEVPTVTAVTGYVKGGDVVYKITFNSAKITQLTGITGMISSGNLSGYDPTTIPVYIAGSDTNYISNNYDSGNFADDLAAGITLDPAKYINLNGTTTVYIIAKGLADLPALPSSGAPRTRIELTDFGYQDVFSVGKVTNEAMLSSFATDIALVSLSSSVAW